MEILYLKSIDSTNNFLHKNQSNLSNLNAVTSEVQTDGKGRCQRKWQSLTGNYFFSILIKIEIDLSKLFLLNFLAPLAAVNYLKQFNSNFSLKFPNDLLLNNQKMGGILVETSINNCNMEYCIAGFGLNIFNAPELLQENKTATFMKKHGEFPTKIKCITGIQYEISKLLNHINNHETILNNYNSYLNNSIIYSFKLPDETIINSRISGVDSDGNVLLIKNNLTEVLPAGSTYISESETI